jgi:NAD(P)-dependent dehydrogenase (short-subunit alcohol dehydrogenase family)
MSDMHGRVCLVTGATAGIGRVTALELARMGATVFLACRSVDKARAVADEIAAATSPDRVELLELDLGSFASVRRMAEAFLARDTELHVLVNNAGIAGIRGLTEDGFELAFGTNHLGHFLLTSLLLDRLRASGSASAPARVVTVASRAHYRAKKGIDFEAVRRRTRTFSGWPEYQVSKLANVLMSAELARRLGPGSGVHTYALHPGVVASDLWRRVPWPARAILTRRMITNEEGAKTSIWCASSEAVANETGLYYDACAPREPSALARDPELARELWEKSEGWVGR